MSDELIRWLPLAIALIGIGIMVWAAVVMRRQEKDGQGIPGFDIGTIKVEEGDTIVLSYPNVLTVEQREAIRRMVLGCLRDKTVSLLFLEGGLYMDVIAKEARPTSDAAEFGGMPG